MNLRGVLTVFRFECKRTLTSSRLLFAVLMALFPAAIVLLLQAGGAQLSETEWVWGLVLAAFGPCLVAAMSCLLWATPVIAAELEGGTWIYLATRPVGKTTVVVGKYAAAAAWAFGVSALAVVSSVMLAGPPEAAKLTAVLLTLSLLACLAYGAIFTIIGVIAPRRAMLTAVLYLLFIELSTLRMTGALKQFAVNFHLRCLLKSWMDWPFPRQLEEALFDTAPAIQHVITLLAAVVGLIAGASLILRQRELAAAGDARAV